jgi:hypothetical protein
MKIEEAIKDGINRMLQNIDHALAQETHAALREAVAKTCPLRNSTSEAWKMAQAFMEEFGEELKRTEALKDDLPRLFLIIQMSSRAARKRTVDRYVEEQAREVRKNEHYVQFQAKIAQSIRELEQFEGEV